MLRDTKASANVWGHTMGSQCHKDECRKRQLGNRLRRRHRALQLRGYPILKSKTKQKCLLSRPRLSPKRVCWARVCRLTEDNGPLESNEKKRFSGTMDVRKVLDFFFFVQKNRQTRLDLEGETLAEWRPASSRTTSPVGDPDNGNLHRTFGVTVRTGWHPSTEWRNPMAAGETPTPT